MHREDVKLWIFDKSDVERKKDQIANFEFFDKADVERKKDQIVNFVFRF
jgi:hypothetical protein